METEKYIIVAYMRIEPDLSETYADIESAEEDLENMPEDGNIYKIERLV